MTTQKADEFVKGENLDVIAGVVSKKDSFLRKDIKDLAVVCSVEQNIYYLA